MQTMARIPDELAEPIFVEHVKDWTEIPMSKYIGFNAAP